MKLERPICSIDVESTGTDPVVDRIIQLGILRVSEEGWRMEACFLMNPGIPIPPRSTEVHHITDAMVKDMPTFKQLSGGFRDILAGCDLAGFNLARFDVPIIWEEFHRAGIQWDLTGVRVVDAGAIFMKMQPRTLDAAVQTYCKRTHKGAHDALVDAIATWEVLQGQAEAHPNIGAMTMDELHAFSRFDDKIDLAGKLVMIDGKPCYGFGKSKGTPICEDMGYADWMLQRDFSANTKMHLRDVCEKILAEERDHDQPFFTNEPF